MVIRTERQFGKAIEMDYPVSDALRDWLSRSGLREGAATPGRGKGRARAPHGEKEDHQRLHLPSAVGGSPADLKMTMKNARVARTRPFLMVIDGGKT